MTTKEIKFSSGSLKVEMCRLRIMEHLSTHQIGEKLGVSAQYVAKVFNSLAAGPKDFEGCPYPQLRSWANKGTESMAELATAIGVTEEELRAAIITDTTRRMPDDIAEKLAEITGIDAKRLSRNEKAVRHSSSPPVPRENAFRRVLYPEVSKYLLTNKMTMTTLAKKCGIQYPKVYRVITSNPGSLRDEDAIRSSIAAVIGKPVDVVFQA